MRKPIFQSTYAFDFFLYLPAEKTRRIRRRGLEAAGYGGNEAFRCREANLLPVTKFIASGLFTKCLGQVDLPGAPLYIAHPT